MGERDAQKVQPAGRPTRQISVRVDGDGGHPIPVALRQYGDDDDRHEQEPGGDPQLCGRERRNTPGHREARQQPPREVRAERAVEDADREQAPKPDLPL